MRRAKIRRETERPVGVDGASRSGWSQQEWMEPAGGSRIERTHHPNIRIRTQTCRQHSLLQPRAAMGKRTCLAADVSYRSLATAEQAYRMGKSELSDPTFCSSALSLYHLSVNSR